MTRCIADNLVMSPFRKQIKSILEAGSDGGMLWYAIRHYGATDYKVDAIWWKNGEPIPRPGKVCRLLYENQGDS